MTPRNDNRAPVEPGPLAEVSYQPEGDRWTLVFVRDLPFDRQRVWQALTEPEELGQWAPFTTDRPLGRTGPATLTMIDGEKAEDVPARVRRVEPPSVLEYTWGEDLLRWELAESGSGTRLTLHHTIEDRDWIPRVTAGWHLCLVVAEALLAGRPVGPIRGDAARAHGFDELRTGYAATLGIDAGA